MLPLSCSIRIVLFDAGVASSRFSVTFVGRNVAHLCSGPPKRRKRPRDDLTCPPSSGAELPRLTFLRLSKRVPAFAAPGDTARRPDFPENDSVLHFQAYARDQMMNMEPPAAVLSGDPKGLSNRRQWTQARANWRAGMIPVDLLPDAPELLRPCGTWSRARSPGAPHGIELLALSHGRSRVRQSCGSTATRRSAAARDELAGAPCPPA
jgi:hypothetical protein